MPKLRGYYLLVGMVLGLILWWWFALPRTLFEQPLATVVEDEQGLLLGAKIAADGQWRFPAADSLPEKFMVCARIFEDRRFWHHPGIDLRALVRATGQNLRAGRVVSGASTLNMQVIRMSRQRSSRSWWQKTVEILLALRLEVAYDKATIFQLWASHASYGGNIVGLETASWRYYRKPSHLLSWAEAATLAVLPNSPGLIHPGRNRSALAAKRNRLLNKLVATGYLDQASADLAAAEPLPAAPLPLPQLAPHLVERIAASKQPGRWVVTLDAQLQERLDLLAQQQLQQLAPNSIYNLAILVLETRTGKTLAYLGNAPGIAREHSPQVDMIQAARSPGSLLKPLLYSLALQNSVLLPHQLLPDIPSVFGGFRPENFYQQYSGAIPASQALARSLNIPFVHLLQQYGVAPFHDALQQWGFGFINRPPEHYGLALILGGCEVSMWQIAGWYSSLARMLQNYPTHQGRYAPTDWRAPYYLSGEAPAAEASSWQANPQRVGAGAAWATLSAMEKLERPGTEGKWTAFSSSTRVAWKTGTSFGFRDAWAVGMTPHYTIAVWVGNADGEGRPGLVGVQAAAPILFDVLRFLPQRSPAWFAPPLDDLRQAAICQQSGFLALPVCPVDSLWVPVAGQRCQPCPYHELVHLNPDSSYRVNQLCVSDEKRILTRPWFVLPPLPAYYYQALHPDYRPLPPWRPDCRPTSSSEAQMQWIYPARPGRIKIPRTWDGQPSAVVFSVAHRLGDIRIYWQLDQKMVGTTRQNHILELQPAPGPHQLVLVDEQGYRLVQDFFIVE